MKNNLHNINQDELQHIAPHLAALPKLTAAEIFVMPINYFENLSLAICSHPLVGKSSPFNVPVGYFEYLPERIANHAFILKHNPFTVPDGYFTRLPLHVSNAIYGSFDGNTKWDAPEGYFDTLAYRIQSKVNNTKQEKKSVVFPVLPQFKLAFAAMLLAIVGFSVYFNSIENRGNLQANLTKSEIKMQAEVDMVSNIDEAFLLDVISEEAIAKTSVPKNNEEISNYLIENNIDINALSDEL